MQQKDESQKNKKTRKERVPKRKSPSSLIFNHSPQSNLFTNQ